MARADLRTVVTSLKKTLVEAETIIRGDISGPIELNIGGAVTGDVDVIVFSMERGSKLEGSVTAESAVIKGRVVGSVRAQRVSLSSDANVEGDVTCEVLEVEPGARLVGRCTFAAKPESSSSVRSELDLPPPEARRQASPFRAGREHELTALADRVSRIAT